jgi:proline iminopeptidase
VRVRIDGADLWFDVEGATLVADGPVMRRRPTVLLLHGGPGFDHACFKPFLSPLADAACLVYLDQRGQGRSERVPPAECTIERMADDAAAVCQVLGLDRPVILGHSFGGFVGLTMALRHPGAVGGLILVASAAATAETGDVSALAERGGPRAIPAALRVYGGDCGDEALADFRRLVAPAYVHDPAAAGLVGDIFARMILAPEVAAHYFASLAPGYDLRSRLPEIVAPTLLVVGDGDWVCPPAASRTLAAGIPDADLLVVPDTGHFPFCERPGPFVAAVRRFLHRLEPSPDRDPA